MSFNATSKLATDWTQDEKAVIDGLKNTFAIHGPTAFYDACQVALAKLSQSKHQKQALLIFTDGHDNTSRLGFDELRRFIQQSRAMIYLVNLIQFPELLVPFGQVEPRETVEISGGDAFLLQDESKINELAGSIALELRRQYTIGFRPTVADKKWHSIKVKVSPIEVTDKGKPNSPPQKITPTVRTRKGYFAN
jgi:Ca-activated chloride channel family protein